jgi:hypothetical protein
MTSIRAWRSGFVSAVVLLASVLAAEAAAATVSFFPARRDFAIGTTEAQSVAVGDFNGDGVTDLAVAADGIRILLGNADGTYQHTSSTTGPAPARSVAVGDFNGDGVPDLAAANWNTVAVFLGNGDGTFRAASLFAAGSRPTSVAVADFNGDTALDVAVTNSGSNDVSVFLGNGDGTLQAPVFFGTNAGPVSVAVGDFNRDGTADLAAANAGSNDVSVLLGNGDGTFQPALTFALDGSPRALAVSDLNGDGVPDLAVVSANSASSGAVLLGNGDGTFLTAQMFDAGINPTSVAVGDLDGDGAADLIVAIYSSGVWVLPGNGDGSFQAAMSSATGGAPLSVVVADINGDGRMDAVTANRGSVRGHTISILIGHGNGTFVQAPRFATGSGSSYAVAGDFNGDGVLDLAATNSSSNDVSVLLGRGDGTFQPAGTFASGGTEPRSVAVGDFNRDTVLDLAVANYSSSSVSALLGNGDGSFRIAISTAANFQVSSVAVGDFNGDGQADLAVCGRGYAQSGPACVLLGNGDGTFRPGPSLPYYGPSSPRFVAVADMNGDGLADLVIGEDAYKRLIVLLGNGDGTFMAPRSADVGWVLALAVGDFNADGAPDVAVATSDFMAANDVKVLPGNGDGTFQAAARYSIPGLRSSMNMGDFNGDGVVDLAAGSGNVAVLLGTGDGTFQAASLFGSTAGGSSLAVGDFNRDGKPDLAAAGWGVSVLINDTAVVPIPQSYSLAVNRQGNGGGMVTSSSNPAGSNEIDCGATCTASYASGTVVTLTAQAGDGSMFVEWAGCDAVSGTTCTVTMDAAKSVTATFALQQFMLTVTRSGNGNGDVTSTSNPPGTTEISCGAVCDAAYDWRTVVTLSAQAAEGSVFVEWAGCDTVSGTTCTVTMDVAKSVTATFALQQFVLTVTKEGIGRGTVTSSSNPAGPSEIDCGPTCSAVYDWNTVVTLTATPAVANGFMGWSGCDWASGSTCVVTMQAETSVTATFLGLPLKIFAGPVKADKTMGE